MSSVLRAPIVADAPIRLPGPDAPASNEAAVLDDAWQAGREQGWADGLAAGRRDVANFAVTIGERLDAALARYEATAESVRGQLAGQVVDVASALVEAVLGHAPDATVSGMLDRLYNALTYIEDSPLAVAAHPDTVEMITSALGTRAGGPQIEVRSDTRLALGEMVVEGPWAYAELTWPRLVAAAREALAELDDAAAGTHAGDTA